MELTTSKPEWNKPQANQSGTNHKQTRVELTTSKPEWNKPQANQSGTNRKQTREELTTSKPEWNKPQEKQSGTNRKQTDWKQLLAIEMELTTSNRSGNNRKQIGVELTTSKQEWN